jgi:hypothetical protein
MTATAAPVTHARALPCHGWLPEGAHFDWQRADQGRDFATDWRGPVIAPADGQCTEVRADAPFPNGFGPKFAVVRIDTGPFSRVGAPPYGAPAGFAGEWYIGHCTAAVRPGQRFKQGDVLAHADQGHNFAGTTGGWVELGTKEGTAPDGPLGPMSPGGHWFDLLLRQPLIEGAPRVFAGKGMWVANGTAVPGGPDALCRALKAAGYRWLAIKAQDGGGPMTGPGMPNSDATIHAYGQACARTGLEFVLWGYLYAMSHSPEQEAAYADRIIEEYGAAGYVADVEAEYEHNPNPVSQRFCEEFRSLRPTFPAACSSFGRIDLHPGLNYRAWAAAGFALMPQAYACESALLTPQECVTAAQKLWQRSEQYVTLGTFKGARGRLSGQQLAQSTHGLRLPGVNLWDAQECDHEQLAAPYGN